MCVEYFTKPSTQTELQMRSDRLIIKGTVRKQYEKQIQYQNFVEIPRTAIIRPYVLSVRVCFSQM